jgi:RNA polymerase sigma-70 factor (ECF subfamily)
MMGLCLWYAKNKEEAEEILQDGFMRVFIYIHTYTGEGSLEGWIRKIMINAALLKYRNKKDNLWTIAEYNADLHDKADTTSFFF